MENESEPTQKINAFTVLFNAVEVANRRGAYSLKESAMISRALDAVRTLDPSAPVGDAGQEESKAAAAEEEAAEAAEPTIA